MTYIDCESQSIPILAAKFWNPSFVYTRVCVICFKRQSREEGCHKWINRTRPRVPSTPPCVAIEALIARALLAFFLVLRVHLDLRVFDSPSWTYFGFSIVCAIVHQTFGSDYFLFLIVDTRLIDFAGLCYFLTVEDRKKESSLWVLVMVVIAIRETSYLLLIWILIVDTLLTDVASLSCLLSFEDLKKENVTRFFVIVEVTIRRNSYLGLLLILIVDARLIGCTAYPFLLSVEELKKEICSWIVAVVVVSIRRTSYWIFFVILDVIEVTTGDVSGCVYISSHPFPSPYYWLC